MLVALPCEEKTIYYTEILGGDIFVVVKHQTTNIKLGNLFIIVVVVYFDRPSCASLSRASEGMDSETAAQPLNISPNNKGLFILYLYLIAETRCRSFVQVFY